MVTAVYKTKWCQTMCWSSASLKSHAGLKIVGGKTSGETSVLVSTNTKDQGGLSFPIDKARLKAYN